MSNIVKFILSNLDVQEPKVQAPDFKSVGLTKSQMLLQVIKKIAKGKDYLFTSIDLRDHCRSLGLADHNLNCSVRYLYSRNNLEIVGKKGLNNIYKYSPEKGATNEQ